MNVEGTWEIDIRTPIGTQHATIVLESPDGALTGVAIGKDETVPLRDVTVDGTEVSWKQSINRPLRLDLAFRLTVDGDTLAGTSKAGRLPSSRVTGHRVPD